MFDTPGAKRAILVVEDDRALGDAIRQCLVDEGHDTTCVTTLGDGRRAIRSLTFHVALIDLHLHLLGETSEPLLEEMANDENAPLAVLMSAAFDAAIVAQRFGIPLLRKPFDLDGLFAAIVLGRRPTATSSEASGRFVLDAEPRNDIRRAHHR